MRTKVEKILCSIWADPVTRISLDLKKANQNLSCDWHLTKFKICGNKVETTYIETYVETTYVDSLWQGIIKANVCDYKM